MNNLVNKLGKSLQSFFNEEKVESIARQTRFVQRPSKLSGLKFLEALVFCSLEGGKMTLNMIAQNCLDAGVRVSEQGLDSRIDKMSVDFMRTMSTEALDQMRSEQPLTVELLEQFSNVFLIDSSQISLPENMSNLFAGVGGCASAASMKIQLVFDYLHGSISAFELCNGRSSDQGYRGHWSHFKAGALYITDLGYFVIDSFKEIQQSGGYFLSRFKTGIGISDRTGERIALLEWLRQQTEPIVEKEILLGYQAKHRLPCRLIAYALPQEVADQRRRKAKENARRQGRTASQESLALLDWAIYITNIPSPMLRTEHVAALYRIRWQIELVFKMCKSYFALDHVSSLRPERFLTEFYARLIGLIITYFIVSPLRLLFESMQNREISAVKVRTIFQRFARSFLCSLAEIGTLLRHITDFYDHLAHCAFKQQRSKSPNAIQAIAIISACYNWDDDPSFEQIVFA